jgi:hypothetical protein
MYGPERFLKDLFELGYRVESITASNITYAIIPGYEIELGKFQGRVIDLGIPSTPDFPRTAPSSIHIKATPQLFEKKDSTPNVRNIIDSPLGLEWRYWSHNLQWNNNEKSTRRLINQIKGIFANA